MSSTQISRISGYLPVLKGIAIVGSLWNAGAMTTAYRLLPSIYSVVQTSPKDAAKLWEAYYTSLSDTVPINDFASIFAISGLAYVRYHEDSSGLSWKLWATAAAIIPIGWVFVRRLMIVPSNKLLAIAKPSPGELEPTNSLAYQQKTIGLLKEFTSLLKVRMMFPWIVGGLALWASLGT